LKRSFTFANTGALDLLTYVSAPAGLTVSQIGSRRVGMADMTTYEMTLNTANLAVGPYAGTITIRTSDPDARERTVHVIGAVTAAPADTPVGAMQRPLDWPAPVSGNQGDWVEFAHTLGPDPTTLHPVKVWSQDYGTLKGVGKYATSFGAGTASYDMFGTGRDGNLEVASGQTIYTDDARRPLDSTAPTGQRTLYVGTVAGFQMGGEVLVIQMQGTGAGNYEFGTITGIDGGLATLTLQDSLQHTYTVGGNSKAQVVQVPHYRNVTVQSGGTLTAHAWDGNVGGIVAFRASGMTAVAGAIWVLGGQWGGHSGGFKGGQAVTSGYGYCGEGTGGPSRQEYNANGNGGGGGRGEVPYPASYGGSVVGNAELTTINLGGGGGGATADGGFGLTTANGNGGSGGGIVLVFSKEIEVTGTVNANGGPGQNGTSVDPGVSGGGGGAGGSILLKAVRASLGSTKVTAHGGPAGTVYGRGHPGAGGGNGIAGGDAWYFSGAGAGGDGRIRLEYCETLSGDTRPAASTKKLDCYIADQAADPTHGLLQLPESGTHTYQVQYGRRLDFGGAGEQTATLRVPAGAFTSVALDALVSNVGTGSLNFKLDIGNDGTWDWETTQDVTDAATFINTSLAAAFNAYWASHGAPLSGNVDVPVKVYLGKAGQVLLTNLQVTPTGSKTRAIRLAVRPLGYSSVAASFTVSGGAGPLAVGVDVGGDGAVDWTYTGSPAYPASLTTGNLAAAVNAYMAGKPDPVDVPIRFYLAPFATLDLTGFTATPVGQADASIGAGDVTFGGVVAAGDSKSQQPLRSLPAQAGAQSAQADFAMVAAVSNRPSADPSKSQQPLRSLPAQAGAQSAQADFAMVAAVSNRPSADPTEGDTITIDATIHNTGTLDTGPLTAAFYAIRTTQYADYLGSAFVPSVPPSSASSASIPWNTLGFTGATPVRVVVDPYNRVAEISETNNVATATVTIRTRPDLSIQAITLSDAEPVAGETVTVTLTVSNTGQTATPDFIASLSDGDNQIGGATIRLSAATSAAYPLPWTPAAPGAYRLFARADRDRQVNESNAGNNDRWLDVYVGFRGPILVDSGAITGAITEDRPYSATLGFGYLNSGTRTVSCGGSSAADATLRAAITSTLLYRFDYLLPGHFYHLDLTLRDCDGNRAEEVRVDGMRVAAATDLSDHAAHRLSLLLDPALYRDRTITVAVSETHGLDALLAEISLHDVDYRYADAGHSTDANDPADPRYPGPADAQAHGKAYGWLDGERLGSWAPANLPSQTVRMDRADSDPADDPDSELRYRFDGLDPARRYRLRLTFRQLSPAAVIQKLQLDGADATPSFTLASGQAYSLTVAVPPAAYAADGSIIAGIVRVDCAASEAQVNEIALEEETLPAGNPCHVQPTPNRTIATGGVTIRGAAAPAGTVIEAVNPRDDVVGCTVVSAAGAYPYVQIYGEDPPTIPGMRDGEIIEFRVNGIPAVTQPSLYWKSDTLTHTVNLSTGATDGQCSWLASNWNLFSFRLDPAVPTVEKTLGPIAGRYCQVRGEKASYDCTLDPVYRNLKELDPGQGYWLKLEGGAGANLRIEGMTVPVTTPIPLHTYWNWVGYLPSVAQPITTALQSIAGRYLLVLSKDKTYDPNHPELSTLWTMEPGQGYQIRATEAVTLVYPSGVNAAYVPGTSESAWHVQGCPALSPTPYLTLLYGQARLDGAAAPAGAVVEIVTPRGDVAGCTVVRAGGGYGYVHVYGEDPTDPPIPGFRPGEPLAFRVNGRPVAGIPALAWQNDRTSHAVDLGMGGWKLWLPAVGK
ncbi:MAG: hypothetical protein FJ011_09545, partial [Chloroflexi bacterium]|nr:hypothetical protein [Chloroflexota bacterium]